MKLIELAKSTHYAHSHKVSEISGLLATFIGCKPCEATLIQEAALFHDIGKSGIPAEILNKPGALTAKEYSIVKTHTLLGSDRISEALHILNLASIIAKEHHEKWDGTGYQGLYATQIHPYARIVSIADVLDALLSKRSYKDPWSKKKALDYIKQNSGSAFDTAIVSALLEHSEEILALYQ